MLYGSTEGSAVVDSRGFVQFVSYCMKANNIFFVCEAGVLGSGGGVFVFQENLIS